MQSSYTHGKYSTTNDGQRTRKEKLKTLTMPKSSASSVIVPANGKLNGFKKNCYNEEFLGKYLTKE